MGRTSVAVIGFGEAGQAFAAGMNAAVAAFDRKTDAEATRQAKIDEAATAGVALASSNAEALTGASIVLSLVTADQALAAAEETARAIPAGALFCDMNSVAPGTKREAAAVIEAARGRYVDVAVMSPVLPLRRAAPLLTGGPHAEAGAEALRQAGFTDVRVAGGMVGAASAIKMIRSVMVKGIEALTVECMLAATAAGVRDAVIASLDASWREAGWAERADYNLDRVIVHGLRRAAELDEVVRTLDELGTGSAMTRGSAERQRAIGQLGLTVPDGLDAKLALLLPRIRQLEGRP